MGSDNILLELAAHGDRLVALLAEHTDVADELTADLNYEPGPEDQLSRVDGEPLPDDVLEMFALAQRVGAHSRVIRELAAPSRASRRRERSRRQDRLPARSLSRRDAGGTRFSVLRDPANRRRHRAVLRCHGRGPRHCDQRTRSGRVVTAIKRRRSRYVSDDGSCPAASWSAHLCASTRPAS
jgi:hypothetical protein